MVAETRASAADTARRAPETGENPPRASSDTNEPTARNGSVAARRAAPCRPPRETATPSPGLLSDPAPNGLAARQRLPSPQARICARLDEPHRGLMVRLSGLSAPGADGGQPSGGEGFRQAAGAAPSQRPAAGTYPERGHVQGAGQEDVAMQGDIRRLALPVGGEGQAEQRGLGQRAGRG